MHTQVASAPEVPLRISLPKPIYDSYKNIAEAHGCDPEAFIAEHLKQTLGHDHSGAGIYFDAAQAHRLCAITGRGPTRDPERIIDRLQALTRVKIGDDINISLEADVLDRVGHNYRVRKGVMTTAEFVAREAKNGIRTSVGLAPR